MSILADRYTLTDVPVRGGVARAGHWRPESDAPSFAVLAVHGVTANHTAWAAVARRLPEVDLVAPDLRGRAGSRDLPGPWGMTTHADDLAAAIRSLGPPPGGAVVVGHSMGAFASLVLARRHPELVRALVLVDGGLPIPRPEGVSDEGLLEALIGPAAQRLAMTFPTRAAYQDFWRTHPAFAGAAWTDDVAAYVDADLVGEEPLLRPSATIESVTQDSLELSGEEGPLTDALANLSHPAVLLRAERGLLDEPRALYEAASARSLGQTYGIEVRDVADVNHYTITLGETGAAAVAAAVREAQVGGAA